MSSSEPESRAERIARYKEQRRKQLTAQYGLAKEQHGGSGNSNGLSSSMRKDCSVTVIGDGPIRTTRTSRLRAAAAAAAASLSGASSNGSSEYLGHGSASSQRLEPSPAKEKTPVSSRLEKDKSAKRKSNLNRSTCSEETADQNDDKSRRRRRRFFPPDVFNTTATSPPINQQQSSESSNSLSSILLTANASTSPTINVTRRTTPSPSHLASPIAVATAVAVSLASPSISTSTRARTQDCSTIPRRTISDASFRLVSGQGTDTELTGPSKVMGGVSSSKAKGDVNRTGAIRKTSGTTAEGSRKGSAAVLVKGSEKGRGVGAVGVAMSSSPRSSEERNLLQQTYNSNKENIRSHRQIPTKPQEPLGRRLDNLTALTQETLAKVKLIENKAAQNAYSCPTTRSRSTKSDPKVTKPSRPTKKSSSVVVVNQPNVIDQPVPVSILKRKVSQEECKSLQTPPVTFSPSVIDPPVATSKRQGILKKRRSLDESQVMRHRSCSPDKSDSRSILKNQKRRSSLEEIARRINSPETTTIPGILKRKTLKMNDYDDFADNTSLNSPQSILKRKSGASSAGSTQDRHVPHVSIATAVILAAADGAEMILDQMEQHVKPILKKKSFSEECSGGYEVTGSYGDGLKPILKKKSSTDTDECGEDRPKRPILKLRSFQQDSLEYYDCLNKSSRSSLNNDSGSECEVKPILKQPEQYNNRATRLSFCEGTTGGGGGGSEQVTIATGDQKLDNNNYDSSSDCEVVKPILKQSSSSKVLSFFGSPGGGNDSSPDRLMGFSRNRNGGAPATRRSSNTICVADFSFGDRRVNDRKEGDRELQKPRTLSVLELVKSFETTTTTTGSSSSSGTIPKKSSLKRHSSERFRTQPITMHELQASSLISNNLSSPTPLSTFPPGSPLTGANNFYSLFNLPPYHSPIPTDLQPTTSITKNVSQSKSDTELLLSLPSAISNLINDNKATSSELLYSAPTVVSCVQQEVGISTSSVSCTSERGGIMSSDSAFQSLGDGLELVDESSDSDVVGEEATAVVKIMPPTPPSGGGKGTGMTKRQLYGKGSRGRKSEESSLRFSTQPITTEEVAEAAKFSAEKAANAEDEFEPANLSIMDKIRLFKMKATEDTTLNIPKRREFRRSTQPITIDEVEIARKMPDKPKIDSESSPISDNVKPILKPVQFRLPAQPKTISTSAHHLKLSTAAVRISSTPVDHQSQTIACDEGISSDSGSDTELTRSANRVARRNARETQTKLKLLNSALESNSDESSGGKEVHRIISKEAVAAAKKRRENLICKSKSHAALPTSPQVLTKLHLGRKQEDSDDSAASNSNAVEGTSNNLILRSVTQSHLAPKGSSLDNSSSAIAMRRNMICELQQQLAQSGNSDWLRRRHKLNGAGEELNLLQANNDRNEELNGKPSILAVKLDELDASSKTWKTRVEKSDAVSFSIAGKMQEKDVSLSIPTPDKHKRTPQPKRFKGKQDCELDTSSTPVSPDIDKNPVLKRSISVQPTSDESAVTPKKVTNNAVIVRTVKINRPDDETFSSFFENTVTSNERIEIDDLDCITRENTLLVQKKNIQVVRRRVASRNPVKTLAKRSDLRSEYTEVSTGVIERETKRLNMEKLAKSPSCNLAMEALAGLASKEDFSSVILKKSSQINPSQYLPYTDLMLLQIKGRKHIQTRLVEPTIESINFGDNYLLITPTSLYSFTGTYSNVIEQSRVQDIANYILQTADLGCKTTRIINVDVTKPGKDLEQFRKLLNGAESQSVAKAGHPDEDEIFESSIIQTNMIYKLENDELVPYDKYWGSIPEVAMLDEKQCLVFDFGSEMYIWSGKTADRDRKKTTLRLAKELWSTGYNYSECSICPISVSRKLGSRSSTTTENDLVKAETRPKWALFAKLTQNRETILFKEKFSDWPDFNRVIKVKSPSRQNRSDDDPHQQVKPPEIPARDTSEPNFIVENTSLGRGKAFFDEETRRNFEVSTKDVKCWNIMENTYEELSEEEWGQFYEGDTYIVRWNFRVTVTGKDLSGKPSKHLQLGRDRCCYFCWFGKTATTNEKGTAALLTVEMDSENAKQYRITQEHEPPAFLQLFNGKMIIRKGRREKNNKSVNHLFMVRGHSLEEASLLEVALLNSSLRCRTSFILQEESSIKLWHGAKSLETAKEIAINVAKNFHGKLSELFEDEGDDLLFDKHGVTSFVSLKGDEEKYDFTPRLFYFSSVSGSFEVTEVLGSDRRSDMATPYPILQSDLYNENQPALFLFDNHHTLYLWHGWWPTTAPPSDLSTPLSPAPPTSDSSSPSSGSDTPELQVPQQYMDLSGSARVRWHAERRAAMLTAVQYYRRAQNIVEETENQDCADSDGLENVPVKLVWAGLEPDEFVAMFPTWDVREDVRMLNIKEDKVPGQITPLHEELSLLCRDRFTLNELKQRPLPIGVDPTHLETYLSDTDFQSLLKMNRDEFNKLPTWKQTTVKKEYGLF